MGSLGEEKRSMWLYPKIVGSSPSERWGHSACFSQGLLYVFGGCCGGMHFGDVLVLNLETMAWSTLITTGKGPGPRDSHSATLWGNKMIVFGGTNGSKKVNDVHILDLVSKEWVQPTWQGQHPPPPPRESHTATLVGGDKLVVFGGSGEGVGNYLNDLHILDLQTMIWTSPEMKGLHVPPPRDSHVTIAVGNKLFVYGGDCGDRYLGDVDVFDMDSFMWSRLEVQGPAPGRRAGHASIRIGTKAYAIGGVGDKKYYNDVWVLDTVTCSWAKLETCGQPPQGRFSHTAVVADSDIAIYGGCGEDERPLGELLILQHGGEHPYGRYNVSPGKSFRNHWSHDNRRKGLCITENGLKKMVMGNCIKVESKNVHEQDTPQSKKKRKGWEREAEQEEHSLSLSQNSSPSQSDQEQTTVPQNQLSKYPMNSETNKRIPHQDLPDVYYLGEHRPNPKLSHFLSSCQTAEGRFMNNQCGIQNLVGADVQGKVDGAFDSGYLMTATVNGRIFRGVLFAAGSNTMQRGSNPSQSGCAQIPFAQPCNSQRGSNHVKIPMIRTGRNPGLGSGHGLNLEKMGSPTPALGVVMSRDGERRDRSDLEGLVLTLGGPASGNSS